MTFFLRVNTPCFASQSRTVAFVSWTELSCQAIRLAVVSIISVRERYACFR